MPTTMSNPALWGWERLRQGIGTIGSAAPDEYWPDAKDAGHVRAAATVQVRRIAMGDLWIALRLGMRDFAANRTDILFLCVAWPVMGLILARLALGLDMLPLLFPLAAGFALIGPLAGLGLNELSRLREARQHVGWADMFGVLRAPSLGGIALLGSILMVLLLLWLMVAALIYTVTLGPALPVSLGGFVHDVFTTGAGWTMIILGVGVGFLFAAVVLAISVISFPLLLDRPVTAETAMRVSMLAMRRNPGVLAAWGLIIAALLVLGSLPALLGLVVVLPVLGHATWHLYRRITRG